MGPSQVLRGAIVGFGQVAEKAHLPGFAADGGISIVAVAESDPARAQAARAACPRARLYASLDELLRREEDLDFVDVATPPFLHAAQAAAALKAGRHVLCEKPLALGPEELAAVETAAAAARRRVFTAHNWAFSPQWLKVLALAAEAGPVSRVELSVLRRQPASGSSSWRTQAAQAGGGILVDHGWHALYLLHRLIGRPHDRLTAALGGPRRAERSASLLLEFPSATAALHLSWDAPLRRNTAAVQAAGALVELQDDQVVLRRDGRAPEIFAFPEKLSAGSVHPDWFAAMLPEFRAALENPAAARRNSDEAAFCLRAICAAYAQAPEAAARP